ncbi:c-type cytochrome [Gimesia fumaroli]|uniref:Cytochrome c n=1 Tax=Gimesia fumaroli TaxID=2527976 RepID=A0A518IFL7_9PLAN|nr:c-type cytochrome [Gimesia fumaroli]QDV51876.1 Cytochrome c [Gimesia fumaroli]
MIQALRTLSIAVSAVLVSQSLMADDASQSQSTQKWTFTDSDHGWTAYKDCTLDVQDNALQIHSTGKDPHFGRDLKSPAGWKKVKLRVRSTQRLKGEIYWKTQKQNGYSDSLSQKFQTRNNNNNKWQDLAFVFYADSEITGLRIDPASRKGLVEIESISLEDTEAPASASATPVDQIKLLKGFKIELLYSVPTDVQGSWVSMTIDPKGRLIASDQYGALYRITPAKIGSQDNDTKVEKLPVDMGMAHGLLYAFDSLYAVVNGGKERPSGLYRLKDTNGDDQFDDIKFLREIKGAGEHGPHAIILSPDKKSLYIAAGNHTDLPAPEKSVVPQNWDEDLLLPRLWDARGHAAGKLAPGGWICRTDPEGKEFEVVSIGFRNEYDIAFNPEGELFTYDADMEWDVGSPWYRPTRVNHVTSGSEFGWRSGTGKWPDYYPDSLPAIVNIGQGSPTGIVFGTGTKFPAKYQEALFISDWSYGIIYAVHMKPQGASYVATYEKFASATPLPVTDLVVNPVDGAFYFTIGGRKTQSGLYRITYVGDESTAPVEPKPDQLAALRELRRDIEAFHSQQDESIVYSVWPYLGHDDRHIRYAARIALEHQPVEQWQNCVLLEKDPATLINAGIALARNGKPGFKTPLINRLKSLDWKALSQTQKMDLLRLYQLVFIRLGEPTEKERKEVLAQINGAYPAKNSFMNRELSQVLVYLNVPKVIERTLELQDKALTQEEQIHYAKVLSSLTTGWNDDLRKKYFKWYLKSTAHKGGMSFNKFLVNIRAEAIKTLTDAEKETLKSVLEVNLEKAEPIAQGPPRPFVKKWTVDELLNAANTDKVQRSFDRGREMFAAATCFKCHRFAGEGGTIGPDLTGAGGRFNAQNLLESIIEPSKVISDQYASTMFLLDDGRVVNGRVINLHGKNLMVLTDMANPSNLTSVNRDMVEEMLPSKSSMMPTGLVDTLTKEEALDLLAYLRSGGNPDHELFKKKD